MIPRLVYIKHVKNNQQRYSSILLMKGKVRNKQRKAANKTQINELITNQIQSRSDKILTYGHQTLQPFQTFCTCEIIRPFDTQTSKNVINNLRMILYNFPVCTHSIILNNYLNLRKCDDNYDQGKKLKCFAKQKNYYFSIDLCVL